MLSIPQEIKQLKEKLNKILCLLGNVSTGGGGISSESDPTVKPSIKTLSDEDVANIKGLITNPYIPLSGYNADDIKYTPNTLFFSNFDYINDTQTENSKYLQIGKDGISNYNGIYNNSSNYYTFDISLTKGFSFESSLDNYGVQTVSSLVLGKEGYRFSSVEINRDNFQYGTSLQASSEGNIVSTTTETISGTNDTKGNTVTQSPKKGWLLSLFSSLTSKFFNISEDGIKTDLIKDANGDINYDKVIVQKSDGTLGKINKSDIGGNLIENDTLESVINRGNYAPKPITFMSGTDALLGRIGINPNTYSYFYGDMNPTHTGEGNMSFGYYSMAALTSGSFNVAYGSGAMEKVTTGSSNTSIGTSTLSKVNIGSFNTALGRNALTAITNSNYNTGIGYGSMNLLNVGYKNTSIGTWAGAALTTGNLNTLIGFKANNTVNFGDRNVFIGAHSGMDISGSNNVFIGVGAGLSGGNVNNTFVLHSNHTLTGYSNTADGAFNTPQVSYIQNALMSGHFVDLWLSFNATLTVKKGVIFTGLADANGDITFTRQIVQRPDGTLGFVNKSSLPDSPRTPYLPITSPSNTNIYNTTADVVGVKAITGMSLVIGVAGTFGSNFNNGNYKITILGEGDLEQISTTVNPAYAFIIHRNTGVVEKSGGSFSVISLNLNIGKTYLSTFATIDGFPTIVLIEH